MSKEWKYLCYANLMIVGATLIPYMIWETWYTAYTGALMAYLAVSEDGWYWSSNPNAFVTKVGRFTGRILFLFGGLMLFLWLQGAAPHNDLFPSEDSELGYLIVLMILIYVVVFGINRK